jgi:superfamily II DNA or RNA helicase
MPVKSSAQLTLRDRLSRLTPAQAAKWLGTDGARLMRKPLRLDIDPDQVLLEDHLLQVTLAQGKEAPVVVTLASSDTGRDRVRFTCSEENGAEYVAGVLAFVLEEKVTLGLAEPPPEEQPAPLEMLDSTALERRALAEREQRAREEKMKVSRVSAGERPWADYVVRSALSGKSYRVALRGLERGESYCTCGDFGKNTLGTCKHVLKVIAWLRKRSPAAELQRRFVPVQIAVHVRYDGESRLAVDIPPRLPGALAALAEPWRGRAARTPEEIARLVEFVTRVEAQGESVLIYPDAEERIAHALHQRRLARLVKEIRRDPKAHPLRTSLLSTELLPYQLDGIAFAAGAGRAVLADEMGLGKTIQGVGVAELLAHEAEVRRVLIICPASLKSQWAAEIARFSGRSVQLVAGPWAERETQYQGDAFFTVCNYEQVLRDFLSIERAQWDLIILDEAQRIKNWEAQTSRVVKSLRSRFALVLTGTPIENRLDDLYSIVEFIDERRLGPAFRFFHRHRTAEESGKVLGYKNLADLRAQLAPVLLRRTRVSVALDLPARSTEVVRIAPTDEQLGMHNSHMMVVNMIVQKKFISEMDLLRLRRALMGARMAADSTFLCDKAEPSFSSKLDRLRELLAALIAEPERKILVFSEWTTMLNLIEPLLRELKAPFLRLDGSVPQAKRKQLVSEFQRNPQCRVFLTTNAGSTGLNLQAADTVINVDLPWNPALLEQRIARAHRMGQKRKVQVYLLVTERTIEESLLATLGAKHELAAAVLDPDSKLTEVQLVSGTEELKRRLEVLLGATPEAPVDVSVEARAQAETASLEQRRERVSSAGGQLLTAAFQFLGELLPASPAPDPQLARTLQASLAECIEPQPDGTAKLSLTLPNGDAVAALSQALARLLSAAGGGIGAGPASRPGA